MLAKTLFSLALAFTAVLAVPLAAPNDGDVLQQVGNALAGLGSVANSGNLGSGDGNGFGKGAGAGAGSGNGNGNSAGNGNGNGNSAGNNDGNNSGNGNSVLSPNLV